LFAVLAGTSMAAVSAMKPTELPGFTLELSEGKVTRATTLPSNGSYHLLPTAPGVANPMVNVYWSQHGRSHEQWVVMFRDQTIRSIVGNSGVVNNELTIAPGRWIAFIGDGSTGEGAAIAVVTCEEGFSVQVIVNTSNELGAEMRVVRAIAESVKCALTAANRQTVQATVKLSRRFGRLPIPGSQSYYSLDDELIMLKPVPGNAFARGVPLMREMILGILSGSGKISPEKMDFIILDQDDTPGAQRLLVRFNGHPDIERRYVGIMNCDSIGATINSVILMPAIDDAKARGLFGAFGCPGGVSTELSPIADVLLDACADGKEIACGFRERL
jgi:hypothetical protein